MIDIDDPAYKFGFDAGVKARQNECHEMIVEIAQAFAAKIGPDLGRTERYIAQQIHLSLMQVGGLIFAGKKPSMPEDPEQRRLIAMASTGSRTSLD